MVCVLCILEIQVGQQSADRMGKLHVRLDIQIAFQPDDKGLVGQAHPEEIGLGEVGAHSGFYLLGVQ